MIDTTIHWQRLTEILEKFIESWESGETPPRIREFLPVGDAPFFSVMATELIKVDLEYRQKRGDAWRIEDYMREIPEIVEEGSPPYDLVYEEFHLRKQSGEVIDSHEYLHRFPSLQQPLRRLLHCTEYTQSTALANRQVQKDFAIGETLDEFVLIAKLGSGAFGHVYLARQLSMQRLVALKVTTRRSNEPETLAQLEHPSIVRVYDQRHCVDQDLWLLYMQFAPGGTLREVIDIVQQTPVDQRTGEMLLQAVDKGLEKSGYPAIETKSLRRKLAQSTWPEVVCRLGIQLALALDYAHRKGVLHRDVKPANVLLSAECLPKLADFNISYASQLEGVDAESFFGGSLGYMSPEQLEAFNPEIDVRADSLDARADLYSLAALLWELLYGVRPFAETDLTAHRNRMLRQLVSKRRSELPPIPTQSKSSIEFFLAESLLQGLAADRELRPSTGEEMARSLWMCLEPKSKSLLELPNRSWRDWVRRYPLLSSILLILVPNGFAGWFNYVYNQSHVRVLGPEAFRAFETVSILMNVIYFSAGAFLIYRIIGPIAAAVAESSKGSQVNGPAVIGLRQQSLFLGRIASMVGIVMWLSSGLLFPTVLNLVLEDTSPQLFIPFLASMAICGLIAAAYPFFGLTFIVVRVFYPALLRGNPGTEEDELQLKRLEQSLTAPLFIAATVPLASILMVVLLEIQSKYVSLSLILSGLLGLAVVYFLYNKIRSNIQVLLQVVRPLDAVNSDTHTTGI